MTNDELLTKAAESRTENYGNADVIADLEELRNLVNTLISTVDEAYVKDLREKARKLFFVAKDESTLYYRKKIWTRINEGFQQQLKELPPNATTREIDRTVISQPRFVRKDAQRVHWINSLTIEVTASKYIQAAEPTSHLRGDSTQPTLPSYITSISDKKTLYAKLRDIINLGPAEKICVKKGRTEFNVAWSTTVDRNGKLTRPQ